MLVYFTVPAAIEYELVENCISLSSYLALYLYFLKKKQTTDDMSNLLNDFTEYFIQMKPIPNLEAKYFAIWFNLTIELDKVLQSPEQAQLIQRIIKIAKAFILTSDEAISPRFLSFIKSSKKNISFR
jgi:hypothetical protein